MDNNTIKKEERLNDIINDLKFILSRDEILSKDIDKILRNLKSEEVKSYIKSLVSRSKPESALREIFFSPNAVLSKHLFGDVTPEARRWFGFIDYLVNREGYISIGLEIKPLFEAEFEKIKSGEIIKRLKQVKLSYEDYKSQIRKYLGRRGEFVILTNLKEWYLFSKTQSFDEKCEPFAKLDLFEFLKEFEEIENLWEYLERKEEQEIKETLDKKFFSSLKTWINELSKIRFKENIDEKKKIEIVVTTINKFIFIQTLVDFWLVMKRFIQNNWLNAERAWQAKGKLKVLDKFLRSMDEWIYEYYDTELFKENNILDYIDVSEENVENLYRVIKTILGIDFGQTGRGWVKGITQYNFRRIDEDIFGKAYETYLVEVRKEQGIFYTPKNVTQYIVENTVRKVYDELLAQIKDSLEKERFEKTFELCNKFISIRVLDPACGSGSFLIKAFKLIFDKYVELRNFIKDLENTKYKINFNKLNIPKDTQEKRNKLLAIRKLLRIDNDRELISSIIIRHIHGNDLDEKALEVAKVNIWLEALKLSPKEFRSYNLTQDVQHVLPDLSMNLTCGDSLVGLPEDLTVQFLTEKYKRKIIDLFKLRNEYLKNPSKVELVESIEKIKNELRGELHKRFKKYLEENNLPLNIIEETKPLHWSLEFWFNFFNENGGPLEKDKWGFDIVIGNPPYVKSEKISTNQKMFHKKTFDTAKKFYNMYTIFTEKAYKLLRLGGHFGFIIQNSFLLGVFYDVFRNFLLTNTKLEEIVDLGYGVFDEAEVSTALLFFSKSLIEDGKEIIKCKTCLEKQKERCLLDKPWLFIPKNEFKSLFDGFFVIYWDTDKEKECLLKIIRNKKKLSELLNIKRGIERISDIKLTKTPVGSYKILLRGKEDICRFGIKNFFFMKYEPKKKDTIYKGEDFFIKPKIIVPENSDKVCGTYDDSGIFTIRSLYCMYAKKDAIDLRCILGILLSKLVDYYVLKCIKGGVAHLQIRIENYYNLPIIYPIPRNDELKISQLVDKIIKYRKLSFQFNEMFWFWSTNLKKDDLSLYQILINDVNELREGNFSKIWTSKVSFYPNIIDEKLNKQFEDFKTVGENDKNRLKIYGINEDGSEELIYEMEFSDRNLMLLVYLAIQKSLESKEKIKTLYHLFNKTTVPVIKPNVVENTPNIIKKVEEEFVKWLKKERTEDKIKPDIVIIDNEIEETDAQIDALVFKIYELNEEEVKTVLSSLKIIPSYQEKVLEYFRSMK
jgi:type I restriction-modification system DNA methylase subunit